MPKSEEDIERAVRSVVGSMAISGFTLTEEAIEDCRAILKGEVDGEAQVQEIIAKCREENGVPDLDPEND